MVGAWVRDSRGDSVKELLTSASKAVKMTPLSKAGSRLPHVLRVGDR